MIGFTLGAYRRGQRRGYSDARIAAVTVAAAFLSFLGGWLLYLACWPGVRWARSRPRWRLAAPAVSAVALFGVFGATASLLMPTEEVTFANDTGNSVTLDGCTSDPASLSTNYRLVQLEIARDSQSCGVSFPESNRPYGCLYLPRHLTKESVIRISGYTPTRSDCP